MTNGKFSCKQPLQKEIKRRFYKIKRRFFQKKTPYFLKKTAFYLRSLPLLQKKGAELIRSLGIVFCVCRLLNDKFRSFHSSIRNHLNHIYAFLH